MKKEAAGQGGTSTSSSISALIEEAVKRLIKGQESFEMIMEDWSNRFPKMTDREKYEVMGGLTNLGFDITPSEWIFYTPPEYRTAMISSQFLKRGKTYGSRYEDVQEAIKKLKEDIKECDQWLKENPDASRMNPQTFRDKSSKHSAMVSRLEELNEVLKVTKSASVYSKNDPLGRAMTILGVNVHDAITVVATDKDNNLIFLAADELSDTSLKSEILDEDSEEPLDLNRSFEMLVKSGDPLQTFFATYDVVNGDVPIEKENLETYIKDFLTHIESEKNLYDFKPEEVNDAFKKLADFVEEKGLNVDVSQYIDSSIVAPEGEEVAPDEDLGEEVGDMEPTREPEESMQTESINPPVREAATKAEIKIADTVRYMNNIQDILKRLKTAVDLPKTAAADQAIDSLSESIDEVQFYIKEELPNEPNVNKEAAYVFLRNITNKLKDVEAAYKSIDKGSEMPYIVAKSLVNDIKKAKLMLNSLG